ncbi:MAG: hypothetical protein IJ247_06210 [Bacilli bacterium]|nr:hypothetical protein [Bacilli bacterium]
MERLIHINSLRQKGLNNMAVSRLVKKEKLGNFGYGFYVDNPRVLHLENDNTMQEINRILDEFPVPPKRVIFSSASLNFCINQLISNTTYIVEIEKGYAKTVFEILKNRFNNIVLLKPNNEEIVNYWKPNAIYVTDLFSRSPNRNDGTMPIEKLIFDLMFDKNIHYLYSKQDIDMAIEMLCNNYVINYKTLFSYAERKNKEEKLHKRIEGYIPQEIKEVMGMSL